MARLFCACVDCSSCDRSASTRRSVTVLKYERQFNEAPFTRQKFMTLLQDVGWASGGPRRQAQQFASVCLGNTAAPLSLHALLRGLVETVVTYRNTCTTCHAGPNRCRPQRRSSVDLHTRHYQCQRLRRGSSQPRCVSQPYTRLQYGWPAMVRMGGAVVD